MYFKRELPKTNFDRTSPLAFWLQDDKDHVISFRDKETAEHFRQMVEESEAYIRLLPQIQPASLQTHRCGFDNNGYVIQLTLSTPRTAVSDIIRLPS